MERPLDCSVAEYGQLALWTGIVEEALGHAQDRSEAWGWPGTATGEAGGEWGGVVDHTE